MELDERPTEQYSDIGGLDKQIEEVVDKFSLAYIITYCYKCCSVSGGYRSSYDTQTAFCRSWHPATKR